MLAMKEHVSRPPLHEFIGNKDLFSKLVHNDATKAESNRMAGGRSNTPDSGGLGAAGLIHLDLGGARELWI